MEDSELEDRIEAYEEPLHDLIEELLYAYFEGEGEDREVTALAIRRRRLEQEKEALKERKKEIRDQINEIDKELEVLSDVARDFEDNKIARALDNCKTLHSEKRDPSNDAIQTQAEKVGLPPQQFIERLNDKYPVNKFGEPIEQ